jgi:hypothetical protein
LAIALLALAGVVMSTTMLLSHTIDSEEAVNIGVEKLDELEGMDYDSLVTSSDVTPGDKFSLSWTITEASSDKNVVLIVEWDGIIGSKSVELKRTISELGN